MFDNVINKHLHIVLLFTPDVGISPCSLSNFTQHTSVVQGVGVGRSLQSFVLTAILVIESLTKAMYKRIKMTFK